MLDFLEPPSLSIATLADPRGNAVMSSTRFGTAVLSSKEVLRRPEVHAERSNIAA